MSFPVLGWNVISYLQIVFRCQGLPLSDPKSRSCLCSLFITVSLICGVYFIGSAWLRKDLFKLSPGFGLNTTQRHRDSDRCEGKCRPIGTETLPEGIITKSSKLEMRLCGDLFQRMYNKSKNATGLLAISAGINQKRLVNEIVKKFLGDDFAVMLFHYDGVVDKWHDLEWSNRVMYLSIIKEEGLEISQPALDPVNRKFIIPLPYAGGDQGRFYKFKGGGRCDNNSTSPPCVGWVEMMALSSREQPGVVLGT
ncbi:hypothetical protein Sango_0690900 [Sesamum angolense]|uniref:Uncharacterized protein n=1 Tax=Sesamum angolense TaxID=2727404 RepID=A0AAE1X8S3_9LAMI|nr:hypothetical protein Sango_0690900 [Sesamum angolense]